MDCDKLLFVLMTLYHPSTVIKDQKANTQNIQLFKSPGLFVSCHIKILKMTDVTVIFHDIFIDRRILAYF